MIRVILFGGLQEKAGWREKSLSFEGTLAELGELLATSHGAAFPSHSLLFAVNGEFARREDPVPAEAEVAVMPPVSGG